MKKKELLVLSAMLLASCGSTGTSSSLPPSSNPSTESSAPRSVEVTDLIGRTITVTPGSYSRIVCVGAGALRLFTYVGDVNLLAGVEDIDNTSLSSRPNMFDGVARPYLIANEEHFKTLPSCGIGGPNGQNPELEKILSCNPDLIISEYEDVQRAESMSEAIGVPVITLSIGSKAAFDPSFKQTITLLGTVLGKEEKATALNNFVESEKGKISDRVSSIEESEKPATYICGLGNWGTTNHLMTAKNYEPFNVANIKNVVTDVAFPEIGDIEEEKFVALGESMDKMIFDAAATKNIKKLYPQDETMFDTCKAWTNNEAYLQMAYNAYYTNIEISLANTWYNAKVVYPDLFEDIDMTAKLNEVTEAFNGKALASEIFAKPQSFGGYQKINTETFFK